MTNRMDADIESQRIDRWLWHARITKTRALAAEVVAAGHVRVNRDKARKPGQVVRMGDVVTATIHGRVRVLEVCGFVARRVGAPIAETLYIDRSPPPLRVPDGDNLPATQGRAPSPGRAPTPRERRQLTRLTGKGNPDTG